MLKLAANIKVALDYVHNLTGTAFTISGEYSGQGSGANQAKIPAKGDQAI